MKKTLVIIGNTLLWLFVILATIMTIMVITAQNNRSGLPSVMGKMPISILSDSMKGTFSEGDMIVSKELTTEEKANLKVGDIITYLTDLDGDGKASEINTHRIVEIKEDNGYVYYVTRGDNAETNTKNDDSAVRYDSVLGIYSGTRIGGLGKVMTFIQSQTGFLVCIVLPLIAFFLFEMYRFIVVIVAAKGKKQLSEEEEEEIKKKAVEEYLKKKEDSVKK